MILQEYPGAIGTHIHATRDETRCFFLVAERESITARNAMSQDAELGQADRANQWKVFPPNDSFGGIISFAGEEIGVVSPEKQ